MDSVHSGNNGITSKSRKSMSRGEMLREASKMNRTSSVMDQEDGNKSKDATETVLNDEKEAVIAAKTNSAADFETRIGEKDKF